jgi:hypothetical protein
MARTISFTKRALITKANSTMVVAAAAAAFVFIFSLVASKALLSQANYQNRIISAKKTAVTQLKADLNARDTLVDSYKTFVSTSQNVLGGNPNGTGDKDGNNAKLVLDALPGQYDFPALATTLEKLTSGQGLQIVGISGTDQELTQHGNQSSSNPVPVAMPFQVQVNGPYQSIQDLVGVFDASIRPFQIQTIELSGSEGNMTATISAQTFFQPAKSLKIATKDVQ